jgi:hypothetical protein
MMRQLPHLKSRWRTPLTHRNTFRLITITEYQQGDSFLGAHTRVLRVGILSCPAFFSVDRQQLL